MRNIHRHARTRAGQLDAPEHAMGFYVAVCGRCGGRREVRLDELFFASFVTGVGAGARMRAQLFLQHACARLPAPCLASVNAGKHDVSVHGEKGHQYTGATPASAGAALHLLRLLRLFTLASHTDTTDLNIPKHRYRLLPLPPRSILTRRECFRVSHVTSTSSPPLQPARGSPSCRGGRRKLSRP